MLPGRQADRPREGASAAHQGELSKVDTIIVTGVSSIFAGINFRGLIELLFQGYVNSWRMILWILLEIAHKIQ